MSVEVFGNPGRVVARLARHLEVALCDVDLTPSQYRILSYLDEGGAAASALADRLAVTRPSITAVVDGLVARGFVQRQADPDDRRRVGHLLTPEGRVALTQADEALLRTLTEIAHCGPRSGSELLATLGEWHEALDTHIAAKLAEATAAAEAEAGK